MRYGIISDIHGNREALESTLAVLYGAGIDRLACLGDIVGYGADPDACVDIVREHADLCVIGNHDAAAVGRYDMNHANALAQQALLYSMKTLSNRNKDWLAALPFVIRENDTSFCHGAPVDVETFEYVFSLDKAAMLSDHVEELSHVTFVGHSHLTTAYLVTERMTLQLDQAPRFQIRGGIKYVFNAGSVGQPRDRDQRACSIIWDTQERSVTYIRVGYDIAAAADKIMAANLPSAFARRLELGV
ncbi:MAG: metallophosphoesterase family protein [Myxococcales bacterium]|nr:metallophosphoesterase family protein [Myxococcales bacterium]